MPLFGDVAEAKVYELAEAGAYVCRFRGIKEIEQDAYNGNGKEKRLVFDFETVDGTVQSDNTPYTFSEFTSKVWTDTSRNKLRNVICGLMGRTVTREEFLNMDTEAFNGKVYKVVVIQTETERGKEINKIVSIKPHNTAFDLEGKNRLQLGGAELPDAAPATASNTRKGKAKQEAAIPAEEDPDNLTDPFAE